MEMQKWYLELVEMTLTHLTKEMAFDSQTTEVE